MRFEAKKVVVLPGNNRQHDTKKVIMMIENNINSKVCELCLYWQEYKRCSVRMAEDAVPTVSCSDWIPIKEGGVNVYNN